MWFAFAAKQLELNLGKGKGRQRGLGFQSFDRFSEPPELPTFTNQDDEPDDSKMMFHGTLKGRVPSIAKWGVSPKVGDLVNQFYGNEETGEKLKPLVFFATKDNIRKAIAAMRHHITTQTGEFGSTLEDILKYGALAIVERDGTIESHDAKNWDQPQQVEPGDLYSYEAAYPERVFTGRKLLALLNHHFPDEGLEPDEWDPEETMDGVLRQEHMKAIEKQIQKGRRVPLQVLKEYPELIQKYDLWNQTTAGRPNA